MGAPGFFSHPSSAAHETGSHPEAAGRIEAVMAELARRSFLGYEPLESPAVERAVLERVHPAPYVDALERLAAAGGGALDADTLMSGGSFDAALHAAGGAVAMVERLVSEGPGAIGFSAHRPPGHHALPRRAMGFCLFNSIAVAARHALADLGLERVLILDWDVHHGNGTNDIFAHEREVLFISIHQSPLYPGTGWVTDVGSGRGHGYTVNLPVPPGSDDAVFVSLVRDVVVPLGERYRPQLVLISAGFDAHRADPLAECLVTEGGFAAMAGLMRDLAAGLEVPLGAVLEGGYDVAALSRSVAVTMEVLAGGDAGTLGATTEPTRLAAEARARLSEDSWPGLAG
jgi:acetoin utilization deacetylase AcuC-like enzyme